jgi:hypothetical protein
MNNTNMQRTNELALLTAEAAEARKRVAQRIENRNYIKMKCPILSIVVGFKFL